MLYSRPFLATDIGQFDPAWAMQGQVTEAVVFDRRDVTDADRWAVVRANLQTVACYGANHVIFHFPVNDSNYVEDGKVRDHLWKALDFLATLGARGLVLHSNQIKPTSYWTVKTVQYAKERFREFIPTLADRLEGIPIWVGLENMPLIGNDAAEYDPTLVYAKDFVDLRGANLRITWDFCHYSYTIQVSKLLAAGAVSRAEWYPHLDPTAALEDVWTLAPLIAHVHFSAFSWVTNAGALGVCEEGRLPWNSELGEAYYRTLLTKVLNCLSWAESLTFEVTERDYRRRYNFTAIVGWARLIEAEIAQKLKPTALPPTPSV